MKKYIDYDKSNSKIFINYFLEDSKTLIKVPLKSKGLNNDGNILVEKFNITNKIYLINIP